MIHGDSPILEIPEEFNQEFVIEDYYPPRFPTVVLDGDVQSEGDEHDVGSPFGDNEDVDEPENVTISSSPFVLFFVLFFVCCHFCPKYVLFLFILSGY